MNGKKALYDSTVSFFEETTPKEAFKSNLARELMLHLASIASVRNATNMFNRIRRVKEGKMIETTFRNCVEREGLAIQQCMEKQAEEALEEQGLAIDDAKQVIWEDTGISVSQEDFISDNTYIDAKTVHKAAKSLNLPKDSYNISDYELNGVNISSDEVGVKRQTECRPKDEEVNQPKTVQNAVIHVEMANEVKDPNVKSSLSYILNNSTVFGVFKLLLGFLCNHNLLRKTLVFYVDGARNLNSTIASMFSFLKIKVILDWYHLQKKMAEVMSSICNNRHYRNDMLRGIMPVLWKGNVDEAIKILIAIDITKVKNKDQLAYLLSYLERNRSIIPNYLLREALGLRNSSNRGEKSNDLIVANRQKHNGMSWSDFGSTAFASVSSVLHNKECDNWITQGNLTFVMVEHLTPIRKKRTRRRSEVAYENKPA